MVKKSELNSAVQTLWETIYPTIPMQMPFLTYAWHATWYKIFGNGWEPYYLIVNNSVIAPFVRQGKTVQFSGGEESADYLDIIGTDEHKQEVWPEIIAYLKTDGVTSLHLNNVPQNSATLSFFKSHASSVIKQEDTTPTVGLPRSWSEYLQMLDHKNKHELERKIRKFEREHANIQTTESTNFTVNTDVFLSLMKLDPKKNTFLTPKMEQFFRESIKTFAENSILTMMTVGDTPAAATMTFICGDELLLYNSGFDESFSGAGFYIKATNMKRAIEAGYKTYNFLQGHERYKYELGGKDFFVYRIDVTI